MRNTEEKNGKNAPVEAYGGGGGIAPGWRGAKLLVSWRIRIGWVIETRGSSHQFHGKVNSPLYIIDNHPEWGGVRGIVEVQIVGVKLVIFLRLKYILVQHKLQEIKV